MASCNPSCCDGNFEEADKAKRCSVLDSCMPLPLPEEVLNEIVAKAKDYALLHAVVVTLGMFRSGVRDGVYPGKHSVAGGAGMRYRDKYDADTLYFAPFFLLPSAFPRREFNRVIKLQPIVNILMHRIAHDHEFLKNALEKTIQVDSFTARLWNIYTTVREEGIAQPLSIQAQYNILSSILMHPKTGLVYNAQISLGMFRCDYFYSVPSQIAQQVEINTVASSFAALSTGMTNLHRYVLGELRKPELLHHLPENDALAGLCGGMISAWEAYKNPKAVIMFLIEDITYNICDQRFHEYEIRRQRPDIHVIRRNLTEIAERGHLTSDKRLIIDGDEVAVIYFRAGYEPGHYHSEKEWDARLSMERSLAIKSPSIQYHLAGTKKVQQEIAGPGVLKKFLSESEAELVGQLFTGLYTLDRTAEGDRAVQMGIENPDRFVLKPQREGGGNNIYGAEIKEVLERLKDSQEREAYILMDRIRPPIQQNYLVRPHQQVSLAEVVSELGIFGVVLGTSSEIFESSYSGHMLRTKLSSVNEGGVAAGLGALDSVFLFD